MREVSEMPEKGQFVAVWEYQGNIWCDTFFWSEDGDLLRFENETDDFEPNHLNVKDNAFLHHPSKFYVID